MSVAESIVHLPSWEDGGYIYTFTLMLFIFIAAQVLVSILKRENKKLEGREKRKDDEIK
ncbi:hypothetical protein [Evansella halocellulosilytica]|uniref:hypothetical protein n=1 Tax=Evansella halocellulosilytica TaxID=2011013 RepID=UPI0015CBA854|nr:hypothetical protein [Evansella halocellulosilytica]